MNNKNNKQKQDCNIWDCISKIICTPYNYIRELCGQVDDAGASTNSGSLSKTPAKTDTSPTTNEPSSQEIAAAQAETNSGSMPATAKSTITAQKRKKAVPKKKKPVRRKPTSKASNTTPKK